MSMQILEPCKEKTCEQNRECSQDRHISQEQAFCDNDCYHLYPWWKLPQGCYLEFWSEKAGDVAANKDNELVTYKSEIWS
jgi:hypothetical protein